MVQVLTVSVVPPADCFSSKAEDRLFRKLFRRYNQFIRPVENVSDPVTVEFEVSISQLVKVVSHDTCTLPHPHTHTQTITGQVIIVRTRDERRLPAVATSLPTANLPGCLK